MRLILLGAPGAGKGTQAKLLAQSLGIAHIASGDLFREAQAKDTKLGRLARSYMERGLLVPDEVTIEMIKERLEAPDTARGFILDGFPRTLPQAAALDSLLVSKRQAIDRALYLKVPEEELVRRLSGRWSCPRCGIPYHTVSAPPKVPGKCDRCGGPLTQREDDQEDRVRQRLQVFLKQTTPLLEYYRKQGKLLEVNGHRHIEEIERELLALLRRGGGMRGA